MKKIVSFLMLLSMLCFAFPGFPQSDDSKIVLTIIVPNQSGHYFDNFVQKSLKKKLMTIAAVYGMSGEQNSHELIFYPIVKVEGFEIVPGETPKVIAKIDVTFFISDMETKTPFNSLNFKTKGEGATDREAYYNAVTSIETKNSQLELFMKRAKESICEFYGISLSD